MTIRAAITLAAALLASGSAAAGDIWRPDRGGDFTWASTECAKPSRPFIRKGDPARQAHLQDYARRVEIYIDCIKREAQRDFDRAQLDMQDTVQDTLQAEVDALNDAMEKAVRDSR